MEISVGMTENNSTHRESQRYGASAFVILGERRLPACTFRQLAEKLIKRSLHTGSCDAL
jgi:hypothetical protein